MEQDYYKTIQHAAAFEQKIKGSRFIGRVSPAVDRNEAEAVLVRIRKIDHDATHHCYAYRIGIGRQEVSRFSDAGEPSGTAGRPILQAIIAVDLSRVVLVVTRYFGGIKLGPGGLARAYGQTALEVLQQAGSKEILLTEDINLTVPYELYGLVQNQTEKCSGKIAKVEYDQMVSIVVRIRTSLRDAFKANVIEQSNGKIKVRE